jgi:4-cresol dehydrogenase (hydroxylating) flavoprotein subunit
VTKSTQIPAGQSGLAQNRLIQALSAVVGADFVLDSYKAREENSRTTIPQKSVCAAVVYPDTVAEIQQILEIAAKFGVEVWPFSRGNNWGYGTKNAMADGAIIVVLERMNRILEVDAELAYAVVEPGVTQQQLNQYLKEKQIRLWADCTDSTPNGSVLGNAVERGYGYTPYGDHFGHLCGLDVVLPNGKLIHTGGTPESSNTRHTFKWGTGPYVEGLFSQSNFGIVVKAGIWLMPEPEAFKAFTFDLHDETLLPQLIDNLRELSLAGVIESHIHMVNDLQMLSVLIKYPHELANSDSVLPDSAKKKLRDRYCIAAWSMIGGIYGSHDGIKVKEKALKKSLSSFGTLEFFDKKKVSFITQFVSSCKQNATHPLRTYGLNVLKKLLSPKDIEVMALLPEMYGVLQGIPTERIIKSAYFKSKENPPKTGVNPAKDGCGVMWIAPVLPATGKHADALLKLVKPLYAQYSFDFSGCFTRVNDRTYFLLMGIFFDQEDQGEKSRATALYRQLIDATAKAGYQPYRSGVPYWKLPKDSGSTLENLLGAIKQNIDPLGILAPRKYGISISSH